jgi:hypothetical protein
LIAKEDYLQFETGNFMRMYHGNSFASFADSIDKSKKFNQKDIDELMNWAKNREK